MTNDANPLYIQHDFAQNRISTANRSISDADGDHHKCNFKASSWTRITCCQFSVNFIEPVFHYETLTFQFEVIKVDKMKDVVTISVEAENTNEDRVLDAVVMVQPPQFLNWK